MSNSDFPFDNLDEDFTATQNNPAEDISQNLDLFDTPSDLGDSGIYTDIDSDLSSDLSTEEIFGEETLTAELFSDTDSPFDMDSDSLIDDTSYDSFDIDATEDFTDDVSSFDDDILI